MKNKNLISMTISLTGFLFVGIILLSGCTSNAVKEDVATNTKDNPRNQLLSAIAKLKLSPSYKIERIIFDSWGKPFNSSSEEFQKPDKSLWLVPNDKIEVIYIGKTQYNKDEITGNWKKFENISQTPGGPIAERHQKEVLEDLISKAEVKFIGNENLKGKNTHIFEYSILAPDIPSLDKVGLVTHKSWVDSANGIILQRERRVNEGAGSGKYDLYIYSVITEPTNIEPPIK